MEELKKKDADPAGDEGANRPENKVTNDDESLTEAQQLEERKFANWGMDGTTFTEFKFVDNVKYSQEIINGARAVYDPHKLESLKTGKDLTAFYAEGKSQILSLCHADQALNVHSDLFRVQFQIKVGEILNIIEPTFKKKGGYMTWVRDNFQDHHIRYFQQAKNLADMGSFAWDFAPAGKNRLLAMECLRKVENKRECDLLFGNYPPPDSTSDEGGNLLKSHIDAIITLHRLQNEGLRSTTFEQAQLIASFDNEALGVAKAREIAKWLNLNPEDQHPALFARLIQDRLAYPSDNPYNPAPKASLGKVLSDLITNYGVGRLDDDAWITRQRELQIMDSLLQAQRLIAQLIERIGTETPTAEVPTETPTE